MRIAIGLSCLAAAAALTLQATPDASVAPAPPLGWNSWDAYGTTVTEAEVKANADWMAAHLKQHGWRYIVVDIQWSEPNPKSHGYRAGAQLVMDSQGRLTPAVNRFPSAADGRGFKPLADYVHARGLKFGIHIMRGIPRQAVQANTPIEGSPVRAAAIADLHSNCKWNTDMYGVDLKKSGGQAYYDSIARLYAAWGVDYIKADDIATPLHPDEIAALDAAIRKTGRPIVLSLSPGPAELAKASFYAAHAQLWRIADDFWDRWPDLLKNFDLFRDWSPYVKPGSWPDGDMLPLGRIGIRAERGDDRRTRFTPDEQRTLITLWSIARSPLMFGGDLPSNDEATTALIANDEVLAANQAASNSRELFRRGPGIAWTSNAADAKSKYLAVFNTGESPASIRVNWSEMGLPAACEVRDLWARKPMGVIQAGEEFRLPAHGAAIYRLTALTARR